MLLAPARRPSFTFGLLFIFAVPLFSVAVCVSAPLPQQTPNPAFSASELQSRAESGDPSATTKLCEFPVLTDTSSPDYDLALSWLQSAASKNTPCAQFVLGYLYEHGKGLPLNFTKAAENYRAAALQGFAPAENNLGALYHRGNGVPKDLALAFHWYRTSALHGNPAAQLNLGIFYYLGYGTPVDFLQAAEWFRASANQGFAFGQKDLAFAYLKGIGVPRDYSQAAYWARLAADQGVPRAQALLGFLYESGQGVPLDYVAAYTWYSRAIAAGDVSNTDRLKSLSQIMTHKQLDKANSIISAQSPPARLGSGPASSAALSSFAMP